MRKTTLLDKPRGFTIVELLMYMAIFSILLLVLIQIFTSILDVQQESQTTSSVYQDGEFILARLKFDIQRAQSITLPSGLGSQNPSLQITIDGIDFIYNLDNGNLLLVNNLGTASLNGFDTLVSNLNFKRIGNENGKDTIVVVFTLTSKTVQRGGPQIKNFQTTVGFR